MRHVVLDIIGISIGRYIQELDNFHYFLYRNIHVCNYRAPMETCLLSSQNNMGKQ